MQGFKSFVDRTELRFGPGITVIVGPNGCGKTNITDAIRWVLGEQSAKQLRGETMEDVIFSGSLKRKPVGLADVTLTLSNESGALPTEYTEVQVGRRVFRSGASEYLFNGTAVRLRDIRDLFYGTGMGSHAYSVIERAMVDHVLSDASGHRRFLFEEAAGITKYKQRKREALGKLAATEADLVRVHDIVGELDRELSSLARQVAKARRGERLKNSIRDLDLRLAHETHRASFAEDRDLGARLGEESGRREQAAAQLAALEARLVEEKTSLVALEAEMTAERQALAEAESLLGRGESQKAVLEERLSGLAAQADELAHDVQRIEARLAALAAAEGELRDGAAASQREARDRRRELEAEEGSLAALEGDLEARRAAAEAARQAALGLLQGESERRAAWEVARARLGALGERQSRTHSSLEELGRERAERRQETARVRRECEQQRAALAEAEALVAALRAQAEARSGDYEAATREEAERREALARLKSRAETLTDLKESMEGVAEGVQLLLAQRKRSRARGVCADFLDVDREALDAAEALAGPLLGAAVVETEADAEAALECLRERGTGHAHLLVLERGRGRQARRTLRPGERGVVGWLAESVGAAAGAEGLIEVLLGDAILVDTPADATRLSRAYPEHCFVSRSGVVWSGGRASGGRPSDADRGLLRRGQELKRLLAERAQEEALFAAAGERRLGVLKARDEAERARLAAEERRAALAESATALEARLEGLERDGARLAGELEARRAEHAELEAEVAKLEAALAEAERDLAEMASRTADAGRRNAALETEIRALEEARRERREAAQRARQAWDERGRLEGEAAAAVVRAETEKRELEAALTARRREVEQNRERRAQTADEAESLERELASRRQEVAERRQTADTATERARAARAGLEDREHQAAEARLAQQELAEHVHRIEMERLSRRGELARTLERLRVEYGVDLESFVPPPLAEGEAWDAEAAAAQLAVLRERLQALGPVNLLALEDYEKKKERHDFLSAQRADLREAKAQLLEAIERINRTASELFDRTFDQVGKNFQETFCTLFQGGECGLRRVGDDPLECEIEIVARPRGKSLQSIQLLSGGERALTAIALLFAIYLVKPSPFCILDEVDAPLDDANVDRFVNMLRRFSERTQFIVVTHNKKTMEIAESLYGVTMQEPGVSRVVSVRLRLPGEAAQAEAVPAAAEARNGARPEGGREPLAPRTAELAAELAAAAAGRGEEGESA
jgi:chromosome segregation protein